ncbi:MAG: DUF1934 domain-containing protein [Lachnoclostridium sp.]|jgi:uncharacterized beta-barrel protein YwiB (DUF1934 family)|nr:DUF1934 domain-containing protein [Lachnoclostridium sp.]
MGQQVIVNIKGIQYEEEGGKPVEVISCGEKYERNGKTYIVFEEIAQDEVISNTIKLGEYEIDIIKRGNRGTHLYFCEGKSSITWYPTPFGELEVEITTTKLWIDHRKGQISIQIVYDLNINHSYISECIVDMSIEDK